MKTNAYVLWQAIFRYIAGEKASYLAFFFTFFTKKPILPQKESNPQINPRKRLAAIEGTIFQLKSGGGDNPKLLCTTVHKSKIQMVFQVEQRRMHNRMGDCSIERPFK